MSNFARALPVTQWVTFGDLNYVPSTVRVSSGQSHPEELVSLFLDLNYVLSSAQGNLRTKLPRGELMPRNRHRIVRVKDFN